MDKRFAEVSRNAFLLILLSLAALSIAILVSYCLMPAYKDFVQTRDTYLELSDQVEQNNGNQPDMEQLRTTISTLKQKMDGGGINLPSRQFESHVINELQNLAWKNSIELGGVRPRQGQVIDHYREVLFDVELAGEYFDLYRFLVGLEQTPGSLVVNELSIAPGPSANSNPELEVSMSIASYRQEPQ